MSEFKSQVYVYVVQQTEEFSLQDIVENTTVYRQAAQFHLKRLVEVGAVEKVSYGRYAVLDTQKIFDIMAFSDVEKIKSCFSMRKGFELAFPNYVELIHYADYLDLDLFAGNLRKELRKDLSRAEKNIRAARVMLNSHNKMTGPEAKTFRSKGKVEAIEEIFLYLKKNFDLKIEHDWRDKVREDFAKDEE